MGKVIEATKITLSYRGFLRFFIPLFIVVFVSSIGYAKSSDIHFRAGFLPGQQKVISFSFSKAVFNTDRTFSFTNDPIITCDKGIGGSLEITSSRDARMYSEKAATPGAVIKCKINRKYFPNINFKNETVRFKSFPFQIEKSELVLSGKQSVIKMVFNDKVDRSEIIKNLSVLDIRKGELDVSLNFNVESDMNNTTFLITPEAHNKKSTLGIYLKNIKSRSGATLVKPVKKIFPVFSKSVSLSDLKKPGMYSFALKSIREKDGNISLRIFINDAKYWEKLINKNIKQYIKTIPEVDFVVKNRGYQYIYDKGKENKYIELYGDFDALTNYKVLLKQGLKTEQLIVKKDISLTVTTGGRYPFMELVSSKSYISNVKEHVELKSTNVNKIKIKIDQLLSNNYRYFVNFSDKQNRSFYKYSKVVLEKEIHLENQSDIFTSNSLNLKEIMPSGEHGIFRINIYHYFTEKNNRGQDVVKTLSASKIIYVSDIGISAKISSDQLFLSASSLSKNTPLIGANVTIYSINNQVLAKGKTNNNGIFQLDNTKFTQTKPRSVIVEKGKDKNFLSFDKILNSVNPYHKFRIEDNYKAMAYMSRKLLRPGDDGTILFIVKDSEFKSVSDFLVEVIILDPTNSIIIKKVITLDKLGVFEMPISIPHFYKTGKYRILMKTAGRIIGKEEFSVEDFIPNRIENFLKTDKTEYSIEDVIKVNLESKYLFGAPASDMRAEVRLSAVSKKYSNKKFNSYSFSSDYDNSKSEVDFINMIKNLKLNKKGFADIIFKSKKNLFPPSILQGMVTGTVFDEGRPVSTISSFDIFPYSQMVGLKRHSKGISESGIKENFETVLLDPVGNNTVQGMLKVEVKKQTWFKTYDKNSRWGYRWYRDYQVVKSFTVKAGKPFDITMEDSGDYLVTATDLMHGHASTISYRVSGWSFDPVSPRDDMRKLDINIYNKEYSSGDKLKVDIKSPISGKLLVTIESGKVLKYVTAAMASNTASIDIVIPKLEGNGFYVSATVTRSTEKDDKLLPFRAFGSKFVKLNKTDNKIDLSIDSADLIEPLQPYKIKISSNASAGSMIVVSIVDVGILQIISQKVPDLFEYFFRKPVSLVALYDIYDNLMSHLLKGAVINTGGDGVSIMKTARMQKFLSNKSINKRVEPLSYWSGVIVLDENGAAEITPELPSFNGRGKIVVIAVGEKSVGVASKDVTIREKVIIKPTYPRFVKVGDELKVPVRVFNKDTKNLVMDISISSSENIVISSKLKKVSLGKGVDKLFNFEISPKSAGEGVVVITLTSSDRVFKHKVNLHVKAKGTLGTQFFAGESLKKVEISLDESFYQKGSSKVYISISDSYLSRYQGAFNNLISYPYGCVEQKSSKLIAMLNLKPFIDKKVPESRSLVEQRELYIEESIAKLISMQRYNGEFNYWDNGRTINRFASVYASDALLDAKKNGFDIPSHVITKINQLLTRNAKEFRMNRNEYYRAGFMRMYSAFLLSENNKLSRSMINSLLDAKVYKNSFAETVMMAAILKNAGLKTALTNILNRELKPFSTSNMSGKSSYSGDFYTRSRDLAMGLWIYCDYFGADDVAYGWLRTLVAWEQDVNYMSTQESAFIVRAMNAYYDGTQPSEINMDLTYNNKEISITKKSSFFDILTSPVIAMSPAGDNNLFNYSVEVTGIVEKPITQMEKIIKGDDRLILETRLFAEDGESVDYNNIKQGQLLYAEVDLKSKMKIENVVVSYELPSCFEPVNLRLDQLQKRSEFKDINFKADYRDIRDDKILTFLTVNKKTKFYLPLRAVTAGKCIVPLIHAEAMYAPEINDYARESESVQVNSN